MKYVLNVISILSISLAPLTFAAAEGGNNGNRTTIQEIMARREEQRRLEQERRQNWANGTANGYEANATNTAAGNSLNPSIDMNAPSSNQSAKAGQGSNSSAGQIAQMVGQALQATGSSMMGSCCGNPGGGACCAKGAMLLGMGILGMIQSGMNKSTAGQHGYVGDITYGGDNANNDGYGSDSPSTSDPFSPSVKDKIAELEGKGFEFNAKNGTLSVPGGKSFKLNDVTNKDAMVNAGVSAADYAANMATASSLEKKALGDVEKMGAHTASQGIADGGSGGGGAGGRTVSSTDGSDDVSYRQKANDPKPTVAGMMKSYNGEMIGVAGDSIFAMMARRYQQKHKEESFLPPDASPAN